MTPPLTIETEPLLFDKLLAPLEAVLQQLDQEPLSQAAEKLKFRLFVRILFFRLFARISSARDLITDLRCKPAARALGLPVVALSTLHDAFIRYPLAWFVRLHGSLLETLALAELPEVQALGQLWCVDSSLWQVATPLGWLVSAGAPGVRLHLAWALNTWTPATFRLSYDRAPSQHERQVLRALLQAGITYILDRGYLDLQLYLDCFARQAFFIVRERGNLCYRELSLIEPHLPTSYGFVAELRDAAIKLRRDPSGTIFRLVSFRIGVHQFKLLTNRWDLTTTQVILLYAWRWQIELIFRAWKHTLGALHWINLSEPGIEMQFHILLMASLLWAYLHQARPATVAPEPARPEADATAPTPAPTITASLSRLFRVRWRWLRQHLRTACNCLALPVSVFFKELVVLRL